MKQLKISSVTLDRCGIAISVLLLGCMGFYSYVAYENKKAVSAYPKSAIIETSSGSPVARVEVKADKAGQVKGLSGRSTLAPGTGMLFPVRPAKPVQVWMKDVNFPLDILLVKDGTIVQVIENAPPCKASPCPVYNSTDLVDTVVELHSDSSYKVGTKLKIRYLHQ